MPLPAGTTDARLEQLLGGGAAAFRAANPDKQFRLNKDQSAECKWSPEGLRLRLRIEVEGRVEATQLGVRIACTRPAGNTLGETLQWGMKASPQND